MTHTLRAVPPPHTWYEQQRPRWTTVPPRTEGHYWLRRFGHEPEVVRVKRVPDGCLIFGTGGLDWRGVPPRHPELEWSSSPIERPIG